MPPLAPHAITHASLVTGEVPVSGYSGTRPVHPALTRPFPRPVLAAFPATAALCKEHSVQVLSLLNGFLNFISLYRYFPPCQEDFRKYSKKYFYVLFQRCVALVKYCKYCRKREPHGIIDAENPDAGRSVSEITHPSDWKERARLAHRRCGIIPIIIIGSRRA